MVLCMQAFYLFYYKIKQIESHTEQPYSWMSYYDVNILAGPLGWKSRNLPSVLKEPSRIATPSPRWNHYGLLQQWRAFFIALLPCVLTQTLWFSLIHLKTFVMSSESLLTCSFLLQPLVVVASLSFVIICRRTQENWPVEFPTVWICLIANCGGSLHVPWPSVSWKLAAGPGAWSD